MQTYLAYFDILGFKQFIEEMPADHVNQYMHNLFRDSQSAVSGDNYIPGNPGQIVPDLAVSNIHCMHISDSIIFWTNDISDKSFQNIVTCSTFFLSRSLQATFAMRGCIAAGEITFDPFTIKNKQGFTFYNSSLYGTVLTDAYLKAEAQDWAGCFIDKTALEAAGSPALNTLIAENKAILYSIPLKNGQYSDEYAIRTIHAEVNDVCFNNLSHTWELTFLRHNRDQTIDDTARKKFNNTIAYLDHYRKHTI